MPIFVDASDLTRLDAKLADAIDRSKEIRREMLTDVGEQLLAQVRQKIGGTGKVQRWQHTHLGTGGGYVAVRAKAKTYQVTKSGKRYAVGYITIAIEGGHKHGGRRGSSKKGYRYRARYKTAAVPGKWFYQAVRQDVANMSQAEVDDLMQTILNGLEGRL